MAINTGQPAIEGGMTVFEAENKLFGDNMYSARNIR
jgi:hypothetical protein